VPVEITELIIVYTNAAQQLFFQNQLALEKM
jgi:hypothetical protein